MTSAMGDRFESTRFARLLFGELADEVDRAFEANRGVASTATARANSLIEAGARDARAGALGRAAFQGMSERESERLSESFAVATEVCDRVGIAVPAPEAFWAAGVDGSALARALLTDPTLVAVPAPHGLGLSRWTALFRAEARQSGSRLSLSAPLAVAPEVVSAFSSFDEVPQGVPSVQVSSRADTDVRWTLRVISAAPSPPRTGMNHAIGPHPTVAEMFMLQLMLLAQGLPPVDERSFTWLHGTIEGGRFAARSLFDAHERSIRVHTREVGNQGPHLGARPPRG